MFNQLCWKNTYFQNFVIFLLLEAFSRIFFIVKLVFGCFEAVSYHGLSIKLTRITRQFDSFKLAYSSLDTRDFPCQYSDKENLWSITPTSIMNSVIFFIFFSVFPLFKQDLSLGSLQSIIFVLIVISIATYQNEIIFKDSRLKCHENINVQKNNIYFRYKHIYKNIYRYIDRYIIEYD